MRLARREMVSMAVVACKDKDQILKTLVSVPTLVYFHSLHSALFSFCGIG